MLTEVEVRTRQGDLLNLPLEDIDSGLIVQQIEGLDPVKATLVSSSFAQIDGEQYQSSRRETRNIKIQLGLEPNPLEDSVRGLRRQLYGFFMPETETNLRFIMDDGLNVDIVGRVESFESALFTAEPVVDISIICFDPDFVDPTPVEMSGTTVSSDAETLVEYEGTVETGIEFTLNVDRTIEEFTLYHRASDDTIRSLDFSAPLVAGDVLFISTIPGNKGATLTRAETVSSILYGISPQSVWTELTPGDNHIRVYAEGAGIPFDLKHSTKYGGL